MENVEEKVQGATMAIQYKFSNKKRFDNIMIDTANPFRMEQLRQFNNDAVEWISHVYGNNGKGTVNKWHGVWSQIYSDWEKAGYGCMGNPHSASVTTKLQARCERTQPAHLPDEDKSTTQGVFADLQREQGIGIATADSEDSIFNARRLAGPAESGRGIASMRKEGKLEVPRGRTGARLYTPPYIDSKGRVCKN
jgi:hypothetical protein